MAEKAKNKKVRKKAKRPPAEFGSRLIEPTHIPASDLVESLWADTPVLVYRVDGTGRGRLADDDQYLFRGVIDNSPFIDLLENGPAAGRAADDLADYLRRKLAEDGFWARAVTGARRPPAAP